MKYALIFSALLVAAPVMCAADPQQSPFVGTWKLNTAKSKRTMGTLPATATVTVEPDKDGLRWTIEIGQSTSEARKFTYRVQLDGRSNRVTGSSDYDTMSVRQIDPYTWETVSKKDGKSSAPRNEPSL